MALIRPGGSGKSTVAGQLTVEPVEARDDVLWLDYEQTPVQVVAMLLRLGADPVALKTHFDYWNAIGHPIAIYVRTARRLGVALVIVDAIIGAMGVEGIDENDNAAVGRWMDTELHPLTRTRTGDPAATVLGLDHVAAEQPGTRN